MSFEFDPNLNIDRAEDDNDPQDIESLAGGEGLFDRVPLPIERQVQAQARGGLGKARGGPVTRSAGQAPGLLGMLGCKPSHVSLAASAASASVIPISGYFGMIKRIIEALGLDDGFHQSPSHWSKTSMEIKQVELLATAA